MIGCMGKSTNITYNIINNVKRLQGLKSWMQMAVTVTKHLLEK